MVLKGGVSSKIARFLADFWQYRGIYRRLSDTENYVQHYVQAYVQRQIRPIICIERRVRLSRRIIARRSGQTVFNRWSIAAQTAFNRA